MSQSRGDDKFLAWALGTFSDDGAPEPGDDLDLDVEDPKPEDSDASLDRWDSEGGSIPPKDSRVRE